MNKKIKTEAVDHLFEAINLKEKKKRVEQVKQLQLQVILIFQFII